MTKYVFISLLLICVLWGGTLAGNFREKIFNSQLNQFMCLNGANISRNKYCDGNRECTDSSDEEYCGHYSRNCPTTYPFFRCQPHNYHKCIPDIWVCDGVNDCPYEDDEKNCGNLGLKFLNSGTVSFARKKAVRWIYEQAKNRASTDKWGVHVQKTSVALYLSDPTFVLPTGTWREMAYEVSIRLLSKLAQRKLKAVPTSDLSSHINALLVTCLDPRKFHSLNLVKELRSRVNSQSFSIPYDILTLCNAGETITKKDVDKLIKAFWTHQLELWTENQAVAVMALVCAGHQLGSSFPLSNITKFTEELKKKQYRNGTVENLHTTALVMQALFAAEHEDDEDNFDEEKALHHIIQEQREDGSFGSVLNNYYVLPVLSYRSMVDINSDHCDPYIKDEDTGLQDLMSHVGPRMRIRYSLWIGDTKDLERILKLRVPVNASFYGVMEIAEDLDPQFRFQYTVKNGRPYVYSISGIQDDVESGMFWFPYIHNGTEFIPVTVSPAELIPKDNDYIAMWYRRGSWIK